MERKQLSPLPLLPCTLTPPFTHCRPPSSGLWPPCWCPGPGPGGEQHMHFRKEGAGEKELCEGCLVSLQHLQKKGTKRGDTRRSSTMKPPPHQPPRQTLLPSSPRGPQLPGVLKVQLYGAGCWNPCSQPGGQHCGPCGQSPPASGNCVLGEMRSSLPQAISRLPEPPRALG